MPSFYLDNATSAPFEVLSMSLLSNHPAIRLRRCQYRKVSHKRGRAIAQAVSRMLSTAEARGRDQVRSCGICGGQNDAGAGFLRVLRFPLPIFIPPNSPSSQSPGADTIGQLMADMMSGPSFDSTPHYAKKRTIFPAHASDPTSLCTISIQLYFLRQASARLAVLTCLPHLNIHVCTRPMQFVSVWLMDLRHNEPCGGDRYCTRKFC
jgi:hypothetical protein